MGFWARLFDFIMNLPPCVSVDHYEAAVRLRFGKYTKTLEPGLRWRIPFVHKIIACNKKECVVDLPVQIVDGIAVEATLRYEVVDAFLAILEVGSFTDSLVNFTCGLIGDYMTLGITDPKELKTQVLEDLKLEAEGWGINVISLKFSTFTKSRAYRLFGDTEHS